MLLSEIFSLLGEIGQDEVFMSSWHAHEHYQEDGAIKKWQNYTPNSRSYRRDYWVILEKGLESDETQVVIDEMEYLTQ